MPLLGEQLNVTELDFESIKNNLISYFKREDGAFTDWDFEGSNLNNIVDLLAYNTHYNAMLAHMAVNESFIDSAQLRPSIVSSAKLLGYTPRSFVSAKADLYGSLRISSTNTNPADTYIIERGTRFLASSGDDSFTFVVLGGGASAQRDGAFYVISETSPLSVYQGRIVRTTYEANGADPNQRYEILDENIDVSTLRVSVFPTASASPGTETMYQLSTDLDIGADSPVYFLSENLYGRYELSFGDGIFGKKLRAGEKISVEYLVTDGPAANGIGSGFRLTSVLDGIEPGGVLSIKGGRTSSGARKESNDSLKTNAINNFSTQNRAVTADDYKNLILKRFGGTGGISSVSVWGGEDNDPPEYGKAFVSLRPSSGETVPDSLRTEILDYLSNKKILSITPEIVTSKTVNIVLDVLVKYDPNISSKTASEIRSALRDQIEAYNTDILSSSFDVIFRHSNFMKRIDASDRAIMNSLVRVYLAQSISIPGSGSAIDGNFSLEFGAPLKSDDGKVIISCGSWIDNGVPVTLKDFETSDHNVRDVYLYSYIDGVETRDRKIGTIDLEKAKMDLSGVFADTPTPIKILVNPRSYDIVGKRNAILSIDTVSSTALAYPDEIAAGGASRSVNYFTFEKDRP
jgi:hypothetical protein